ncbi:MAG: hypothetical protein WC132_05800, partial [Methanomethylophilus sp.]
MTLDGNGGSDTSVTATYGAALPSFVASEWTGYTLTGYWTEPSGGTMVIDKAGTLQSAVSPYSDASDQWSDVDVSVTLYAQWVANTYTVTFYDEDRSTLLGTDSVHWGETAAYSGSTPTQAQDETY